MTVSRDLTVTIIIPIQQAIAPGRLYNCFWAYFLIFLFPSSWTAMHQYINNNDPSQMNYHDPTSVTSSGMTVPYNSVSNRAPVPQRCSVRSDYDQQASPPTAINAITIASNILSGEGEGLEACTAASVGMHAHSRRSIKDEDSHCLPSGELIVFFILTMPWDTLGKLSHHVRGGGGTWNAKLSCFHIKLSTKTLKTDTVSHTYGNV